MAPGEIMVSAIFESQFMEGSLWGTDSLNVDEIWEFWTVAPMSMSSKIYTIYVALGLTETITLEGTVAFTKKKMENWMPGPTSDVYLYYETRVFSYEDLKVSALWSVLDEGPYRAHIIAGVSLPAKPEPGSRDDTPFSNGDYLGYPMQIGSGTLDFLPGFTFQVQNELASFGMQGKGTIRWRTNDRGWALGDRYMGTVWGAYRFGDYISASARIEASRWANVDGNDSELDPLFSPAHDPIRMGGTRVDLPLGVNIYLPEGPVGGFRVSVEGAIPLYQDLDGPQLKHDWTVRLGAYKVLF